MVFGFFGVSVNYSNVVAMVTIIAVGWALPASLAIKASGTNRRTSSLPLVLLKTRFQPQRETSSVMIPISVSLAEAFNQLEDELPPKISRWDAWDAWEFHDNWATKYHFRRDPLSFSLEGNLIKVTMKGYYKIKVGRKVLGTVVGVVSCGDGEPEREVELKAGTIIRITSQWQLETKSALQSLNYPNRCNATFLNLDATGYINSILEPIVKNALSQFDARTRGLNLRRKIEDLWQQAQGPLEVGDNAWLLISPETVLATPISTNNEERGLNISMGITAHPRVQMGSKPQATILPLPDLQTGEPLSGFHIDLEGEISYASATDLLRRRLVGRQFEQDNYRVTISDAQVSGSAGQAVLRLKLQGSINGQINLTGKPQLDLTQNLLYIEDLDYTLETRNFLLKIAELLKHAQFQQQISEAARFPLSDEIAQAKSMLTQSLNRQITPEIKLHGAVTTLRPKEIFVGQNSFVIRVVGDGEIRMQGVLKR